ncbi:MAG: hypothetical protein ACTSRS_13435 [Candidatus Helarchaeota archaeon]
MSDDDEELARLRHKKIAQMMQRIGQEKRIEKLKKDDSEKTEQFLKNVMQTEALAYYKTQILPNQPLAAKRILEVIKNLISMGLLQQQLNREQLILLHRKILGIGPNIKVKRPGKDYTDLASELRKK